MMTVSDLRQALSYFKDTDSVVIVYTGRDGVTQLDDLVSWTTNGGALQLEPVQWFAEHRQGERG